MKPLTNEQKKIIDDLDKSFGDIEFKIDVIKVALEYSGLGNFESLYFYQGILHYLTWPKVG